MCVSACVCMCMCINLCTCACIATVQLTSKYTKMCVILCASRNFEDNSHVGFGNTLLVSDF